MRSRYPRTAGRDDMTRKAETAIYINRQPVRFRANKWEYEDTTSEVRVMARGEGYAMVRHKGCFPFVVSEKMLRAKETT